MTLNSMADKVQRLIEELGWEHDRLEEDTWAAASGGQVAVDLHIKLAGEFLLITAAIPIRVRRECVAAAAIALLEVNANIVVAKCFVTGGMVLVGTEIRASEMTLGLLNDALSSVSLGLDCAVGSLVTLGTDHDTGTPVPDTFNHAFETEQ